MKLFNRAGMASVCIWSALLTNPSYAQQKLEKPGFYTSLTTFYTSDDNIFRQSSSQISDTITTVSPEISYRKTFSKHQFSAEYLGEFASFSKNQTEDYTDNSVNLGFLFDFTRKFDAELKTSYKQGHESRGSSGVILVSPTKPTTWNKSNIFAGFTYGRKRAKAQIEMDYSRTDLAFTNNAQEYRDRKNDAVSARIIYRLGRKTAAFIEGKQNKVDYVNLAARNLDSNETFSYLGLRWDASFKTKGDLKIGRFKKNFNSAAETDGLGTSYEANIYWEPKTYSRFNLGVSRIPKETSTTDSFYTSSQISIDWLHDFNSSFALTMNASSSIDEYSSARKDKLLNNRLGLNYQAYRWIHFGLNYTYSKRDSTDNTADFTDNLLMLNVTLTNL